MARPTDEILAKYVSEIEDRQQFIDSLIQSSNGDDLSDEKMELVTRAKDRINECNRQMAPLEEARRISGGGRPSGFGSSRSTCRTGPNRCGRSSTGRPAST